MEVLDDRPRRRRHTRTEAHLWAYNKVRLRVSHQEHLPHERLKGSEVIRERTRHREPGREPQLALAGEGH